MATVCNTANQLGTAPNDCCSELQSATEAICDAWPLELVQTRCPVLAAQCACRAGMGAARSGAKRPRNSSVCLEEQSAALIDLDQLPK